MWSHLAEQLRAKPMGHGAARQPKGCSKEVNKGLPAALPGLQEPRESPARQCGGRSKSWFVSRKNTCPVKFHLGRSSKVNGWELVSLQWRAWQKSDKNNGYFSSQKLFPGRAPWFWHVLQCSVLSAQCSGKSLYFWICSPAPPVAGDWNVDRFQFQVCHKARGISGWIQRDLKVILILPSPKGGCACDSSVSASKGKSCSLLPWKGCWGALLMSPDLMDAQTQHTSHSKHFWSSIFPGRSQAGQSLCVLQTGQM